MKKSKQYGKLLGFLALLAVLAVGGFIGSSGRAAATNVSTDTVCGNITGLVLVNAATNQDIMTMVDGSIIDAETASNPLTIRADVDGSIGSIKFMLGEHHQIENYAPYAMYGDSSGDYSGQVLSPGSYSLTSALFSRRNLRGQICDMGTINFTVADGQVSPPEEDAGNVGGIVWGDTNNNGVVDTDESRLEGVLVGLFTVNYELLETITTGSDGSYLFEDVSAGNYLIQIDTDTLPGYSGQTFDPNGIDTPDMTPYLHVLGEDNLEQNFGYSLKDHNNTFVSNIGDTVFVDNNTNGVQDADDAGLEGILVGLFAPDGTLLETRTTDVNGMYLFSGLAAGDYVVRVDVTTLPSTIGAQTVDASGDQNDSRSELTLVAGIDNLDQAFGYEPEDIVIQPTTSEIGNRVWLDRNGDGAQDLDEPGIEDVRVALLDADGNEITSVLTDSEGNYLFTDLGEGTYTISVDDSTLPDNVLASFDADGIDTVDITTYSKVGGVDNLDQDFGYKPLSQIGDRVWLDTDGDGFQELGEDGINGVTVNLYDNFGTLIDTKVTSLDGIYVFTSLGEGTYRIEIDPSTLPAGLVQTFDQDGLDTPHTTVYSKIGGENNDAQDFGYVALEATGNATIGSTVFSDTNNNGVQDPTEVGVEDATVNLYAVDAAGNLTLVDSVVTDENGDYLFTNIVTGEYVVEFVLPGSYVFTSTTTGSLTDGNNSDVSNNDNVAPNGQPAEQTVPFTVNLDEVIDYIGAGAVPPTKIAGCYSDDFDVAGFANRNGEFVWNNDWQEIDAAGVGVSVGEVTISDGSLHLAASGAGETGVKRSLENVGSFETKLIVNLSTTGVVSDDARLVAYVQVDGAGWVVLSELDANQAGQVEIDMSAYASANTEVALSVVQKGAGSDVSTGTFDVDGISICPTYGGGDSGP